MVYDRYFSTQTFDSSFTWASPEILIITRYDAQEMIGKNPYDFFHKKDLARIVKKHMDGLGLLHEDGRISRFKI